MSSRSPGFPTLGSQFADHVLECFPEGVYVVDTLRRIAFWNRESERLTGYARAEVEGRLCFEGTLCHVDAQGRPLCHDGCPLEATMRDRKRRTAEVYLQHKSGARVPVLLRTAPLLDDDGHVVGAIEVFYDNTDHVTLLRRLVEVERKVRP